MSANNQYLKEFKQMAIAISRVSLFTAKSLQEFQELHQNALKAAFLYEQHRCEQDYIYCKGKLNSAKFYSIQMSLQREYLKFRHSDLTELQRKYERDRGIQVQNVEKYYRESMRKLNEPKF